MTNSALPDLTALTTFDQRLREIPTDPKAVEEALRRGREALARTGDDAKRIKLLGYVGNAERILGRPHDAVVTLRRAVRLATRAGDTRRRAISLMRLGEAHRCADDFVEAESAFRAALRELSAGDLVDLRDFALQHLGKCLTDAGRRDEAIPVLEDALALRESKGDPELLASTRLALERARETESEPD